MSQMLERAAFVIDELGRGGTERQLVLLAGGLRDRGVQVEVASLLAGGPNEEELRKVGVPVFHPRFPSRSSIDPLRLAPAVLRLGGWLRRVRPQVVHAFLLESYLVTPPVARLTRVPAVVAGRRSLGYYKEHHRPALVAERIATKMTDLVVANANAVAEDSARRERLPRRKLRVIHNGVPDAAFEPAPPACLPSERPVVLCVANLIAYKGHLHLLDAIHELEQAGRPVTLVLAGDGPMREEVEKRGAQYGLDLRLLGSVPDARPLLARADVVVLPSLQEGLSNAVLEAMAAGKAIVATDVGGNREALGCAGLLVAPGQPSALAAAMTTLLRDGALRGRLGEAARERARSRFTVARMIDEHIKAYESLL